MRDRWRWFWVHLIPTQRIAWWLWDAEWIPLRRWAPFVLGRALGSRPLRMDPRMKKDDPEK